MSTMRVVRLWSTQALAVASMTASSIALAAPKVPDYPPGWTVPTDAKTVTGVYVHAVAVDQSSKAGPPTAVLEAAKAECAARGRELQVLGDESILSQRAESWLYRTDARVVIFELSSRLDLDKRVCTARISEVRDIDICDKDKGIPECAVSNNWPAPFRSKHPTLFDTFGHKEVRRVSGIDARCISEGEPAGVDLCLAVGRTRARGLLLSENILHDANRTSTFNVDKVIVDAKIDATIFENSAAWYPRRQSKSPK
jgi:hypothetical protein